MRATAWPRPGRRPDACRRAGSAGSGTGKLLLVAVAATLAAVEPPPATAGGVAASGAAGSGVPPLGEFLEQVRSAEYARYAARPGSEVADEAAFAEMKAYLLGRYKGIDPGQVRRVLVDGNGSVFDCIPVGRQPASRDAPDPRRPRAGVGGPGARPEAEAAAPGVAACPPGTIPLQRITLETLTRFTSLREFYRK